VPLQAKETITENITQRGKL